MSRPVYGDSKYVPKTDAEEAVILISNLIAEYIKEEPSVFDIQQRLVTVLEQLGETKK